MTWSKNESLLIFSPNIGNRFATVSWTVRKREAPDRPCVQLNSNMRSPSLCELWVKRCHLIKQTNLSLWSDRPTLELTNHCKQHSMLSEVCAPSRYHVVRGKRGSETVWQRPGHLVAFKPDMYDSGILSFKLESCRKAPVRSIARLAFWYWWAPDRPTKGRWRSKGGKNINRTKLNIRNGVVQRYNG